METLIQFMHLPVLGQAAWVWLLFAGIVVTLLALDLGVLHKDDHEIGVRESLFLSAGYISMALLFGAWVWWFLGAQSGIEYFTGFLIEKSLSMDNVFVIALIFSYLAIPRQYQHRVLFWGIMGVIVLRAILIGVGAALVSQFSWILYLFGAFLVVTGIKMWLMAEHTPDIANNPVLKFLRRHLRVTPEVRGNAFFVQEPDPATGQPVRWATPLFLALCMVELVDLVFAVDSVPAIFFCHHRRPLHRLHQQHLCHPRTACAVLRAGRHDSSLHLPQVRPGAGAGVRWQQDLSGRHHRQDPAGGLT